MGASFDIKGLIDVSWRRVGVPLLGLCAGLMAAQAVTEFIPPRYEAQATILVTAVPSDDDRSPELSLAMVQNLAPTIARLVASGEVARDAATSLQLPERRVFGHVRGEFEPGLQIIAVRASAASAGEAAAIANAASRAVGRQLSRLEIGGESTVTTQVLDTASPPIQPAFPKPLLNGALGALAGLLAGWGATLLRDRFDRRFRDVGQIESRLGLPVIGVLPQLPRRFARHHAAALYGRTDIADAVRATTSTLSMLTTSLRGRRVLVTSAHDDDGKALVTALLGLGMADEHCRVTLVDGAMRDPVLAGHFPDAPTTWQQLLAEKRAPAPLPDFATLSVLPTEPRDSVGTETLADFGGLLAALGESQDCVIVHAPPVLAGREVAAFAQHADGVLLVVQAGRTNHADASRAARLIRRLGLPLAGVVAVGVPSRTDAEPVDVDPTDQLIGARADGRSQPAPRTGGTYGPVLQDLVTALLDDPRETGDRSRRRDGSRIPLEIGTAERTTRSEPTEPVGPAPMTMPKSRIGPAEAVTERPDPPRLTLAEPLPTAVSPAEQERPNPAEPALGRPLARPGAHRSAPPRPAGVQRRPLRSAVPDFVDRWPAPLDEEPAAAVVLNRLLADKSSAASERPRRWRR